MENPPEKLVEKLADSLAKSAENKRKQAIILERIAYDLDVNGVEGLDELLNEYEKFDIEIEAVEQLKDKL